MHIRRTLANWRWWLILPYAVFVCLPVALTIWIGEWLQEHENFFRRPLQWAAYRNVKP